MAKYPNDDLFENTKMSFGDHLEELRVSLFRAVVGLVIGFAIGLMVSKHVMNWMQYPLKAALENYYIEKAVDDLRVLYQDDVTPDLEAFVRNNRLVFDEMYLEAAEIQRIGGKLSEGTGERSPLEAATSPAPTSAPTSAPTLTEAPAAKAVPTPPADAPTAEKKSPVTGESPEIAPTGIPKGISVTPGGLSIHHDDIPPPKSFLVNFRTWRPVKMEVRSLNAQEAFMIWMKAGFISGIVVASPWIFWQVWNFVAAGLYPHEKNYVYMYLPFSMLLFLAGGGMAFFFVFEPVLNFLFSFNKVLNIDPDPRISEWLGFVLILPLGFGVSFQLPLVMLFINRLGLVSLKTYIDKWRVAILAIFVISAVLTPADPISIFLMAVPLTLLYFLGLGLCKWMPRSKNPYAEGSE